MTGRFKRISLHILPQFDLIRNESIRSFVAIVQDAALQTPLPTSASELAISTHGLAWEADDPDRSRWTALWASRQPCGIWSRLEGPRRRGGIPASQPIRPSSRRRFETRGSCLASADESPRQIAACREGRGFRVCVKTSFGLSFRAERGILPRVFSRQREISRRLRLLGMTRKTKFSHRL